MNFVSQDLIIYQAADQCVKKKRFMTKTKPKKSSKLNKPKWYDTSLIKLRRQLDAKERIFKKYGKDPVIRNSFFSHLKLYRKTRKYKIKEYHNNATFEHLVDYCIKSTRFIVFQ
jgi:uncharacterized protein (DUF342 family)